MITLSSGFLAPPIGALVMFASFLAFQPTAGSVPPDRLATASIQKAIADLTEKATPAAEAALSAAAATVAIELATAGKP
jgi:hypothetical protein